jgi:hypothetical protein
MARYRSWWNWMARRSKAKPRSARWLGPVVYALDWVAMRTPAAPTTKFALLRRPAGAGQSARDRPPEQYWSCCTPAFSCTFLV